MADLDALFEACLIKIESGSTIEECLANHPAEANDLASLLQIASALRHLGGGLPARDPAAIAAGRDRFLAQVVALQRPAAETIEDALDASSEMLATGATIDDCLDAFPLHADELRTLLETVADLQRVGQAVPARDPAAVAAGRTLFLARARAFQQPASYSVDEALEASTQMLAAGATIEDCLDAFPYHAAELRSLLETVSNLRGMSEAVPPRAPEALAADRQRFLARATALKQSAAVSVDDAFEASLQMLASGIALEQCLDTYPHHAAELRSLLETVTAVRALAEPVPPRAPASVAAARRAFLQAAGQQARRRTQPRAPAPWSEWLDALAGLFQPLARGFAVTAALILVVILSLGTGAVALASTALPGDYLYPVKLAGERVRVAMTRDDVARQQLVDELEEMRRNEAVQVAAQGRVVRIVIPGFISSMEPGLWRMMGLDLPLDIPSDVEMDGEPVVGSRVIVTALSDGKGNLIARHIRVLSPPPEDEPRSIVVETATATPTASQTPTWTSTPAPTATPWPTDTPVPPATPTHTATPSPTATATPTTTPTPSATPTASPTATPILPRPVRVYGLIEEKHPDHWLISGQLVRLDVNTVIDESLGQAVVGAEVEVDGWSQPEDGSVLATLITVINDHRETTQFTDYIRSMGPGPWRIGNTLVEVSGRTVIVGTPAVGKVATVTAERYAGQIWQALKIVVDEPEYVYIVGVIESIDDGRWVVRGQTIIIDPTTQITGADPAVGLIAQVQGIVRDDGVHAVWILVKAPTATPTRTPTATVAPPTATPTATPQLPTATPSATPEPPTATPTMTPEPPTATPTSTPAPPTATPTDTATPAPPTATPTDTATPVSPTATPTDTATPVAPTATSTPTAQPPTATPTDTATPEPPTVTPTPVPALTLEPATVTPIALIGGSR